MNLNKAFVIGNLTRDPELKTLPSGSAVCNFSVATNRTWKDKNGEQKKDVEFHNIVAFGRTAEIIHQYMKKGNGIFIEGRIQTRSWEKDGKKNYRTEIVAEAMQFGPRLSGYGGAGGAERPADPAPAQAAQPAKEALETINYDDDAINPDEIPF
ncbi:MAG: single-stranded DNA-binding protein [Candidatus Niyogibacteria bacterium]|nr:single-stranded DNA-binding protein [Candidatus Niyogibacteria bacterium]